MKARWESKALSEVCQFINRGISPAYVNTGGVAVLNQKCVRDHAVNFDLGRRHDTAVKKVSPERLLRAGDVLVNSTGTGTLGRVAQLRLGPSEPTTVDSHVTIVRPAPGLFHPEFFGYALVSIEGQIQAGGEGCGGQTELSRSKLAEGYRISFPTSQDEQRRIVAILDEAFEGISTAKAHAERSLRNAREVFDDYLASVFSDHNAGWESAPIEQHVRFIDYRGRTPEKTSEGVRLITAKNVKRGFVQREPMEFVAPDSYDEWMTRGIPKVGDVLFTTEAPLGHVAQLDTDERVVFAQRVIIMQADSKVLDSTFFKYLLLSAPVQAKIHAQATGATAQGIKASRLKRIEIPFPSDVAEQRLIASRLDVLAEDSSQLEDLYQRKRAALEELKQSLLHQAFSGQL